jgi:hypothetical protein
MLPLFLDTDQHGTCLAHFVEQPNAGPQARLKAGARHERTLAAVACRPSLGVARGQHLTLAPTSCPLALLPRDTPPVSSLSQYAPTGSGGLSHGV